MAVMTEDALVEIIRALPGMTGVELVDGGFIRMRDARILQRLEMAHRIVYRDGWYAVEK